MAGHPLRPAIHRRLGGLLPHQLANRPRAHPVALLAQLCFFLTEETYAVLSTISRRYSSPQGRLPTCYSPVRHSLSLAGKGVRLACVRHAASVNPEPGSNSSYSMFRTHSREVCSETVERSQPNMTLGCFALIDRNCFANSLLFCFPLFNC